MSTAVQNGVGDSLSVTTSAAIEYVVPNPTNGGGNNDWADELHIWNTGATDVRVQINVEVAGFTVASAAIIPAGESHYFFTFRNPIKRFVYATESGTSTIKYAAS